MIEFDFKTISIIATAVLAPSVLLVFKEVFEKPIEPATEIFEALNSPLPLSRSWLKRRRKAVFCSLIFIPRLLLSNFFLALIVTVLTLVIVGPDRILDPYQWGFLAEPLTKGERVVYVILLFPTVAVYIWRVSVPVWKGWSSIIRATCWLRKKKKRP